MTSLALRSLPKYRKGSIGVAFASITDDEEPIPPSPSSPKPEGVSSKVNDDDVAILSSGSVAAINRLRLVRLNADEPPQNRDEGDTIDDIDDDDEELERNEDGDIDDTEDEQDDDDDEIIRLQQELTEFNSREFFEDCSSSSPVNIGALDGLEL